MTGLDRVPLSARVDPAFRDRVIANGRRHGEGLISDTVRRLLELGLAADERAGAEQAPAPRPRRRRSPTRRGRDTARYVTLEAIVRAGVRGMTADEAAAALPGRHHNTIERRFTDLAQDGHIAAVYRHAEPEHRAGAFVTAGVYGTRPLAESEYGRPGAPVTRYTRRGAPARVFAATASGVAALGRRPGVTTETVAAPAAVDTFDADLRVAYRSRGSGLGVAVGLCTALLERDEVLAAVLATEPRARQAAA